MLEQSKALWKYLLFGIFTIPVLGEVPQADLSDTVIVAEEEGKLFLKTAVMSYQKDQVQVDLVGAVHLADASYFDELNTLFQEYDVVLFEAIGDGSSPARYKKKRAVKNPKTEMDVVSQMYGYYEKLLDLEFQMTGVDYSAQNFLHADMSLAQFQKLQEEQGESLMGFAMQNADLFEDIEQTAILGAMLTGDSTALKNSFIHVLGGADNSVLAKKDTSVIINARNTLCLKVLEKELKSELSPSKVAIFYGAAHLPDFHQQLKEKGWKFKELSWLTAWSVKKIVTEEE